MAAHCHAGNLEHTIRYNDVGGGVPVRNSRQKVATSIAFVVVTGFTTVTAQSVQPTVFQQTGTFSSNYLSESSGVAVSRSQPGVIWTHNDSGDRAMIYATNLQGADLGRFRVRGADAEDWEDIALGPCPGGNDDKACLYIADTGDNEGDRRQGVIYIVAEPNASTEMSDSEARTDRAHELRVTYPHGPRDIEALAVTPGGDVLLITKGSLGPVFLYTIPARMTDERSARVDAVDTLPIFPARSFGSLVTAAAVSPSGQRLVVRTYTELFFFMLDGDGTWRLRGEPCWIGLRQPQGEGVDFIDETAVVLTSESALGKKAGLARGVCPLVNESGGIPQNGG